MPLETRSALTIEPPAGAERSVDSAVADDLLKLYAVATGSPESPAGAAAASMATGLLAFDAQRLREAAVAMEAGDTEWEELDARIGHVVYRIYEAIRLSNLGRRDGRDVGASVTALLLGDSGAAVIHAGYTRAYLIRDGQIVRLNRAPKLPPVEEEGDPCDSTQVTLAARAVHAVKAPLGSTDDVPLRATWAQVLSGDRLVLLSDGATRLLRGAQIEKMSIESTSARDFVGNVRVLCDAGGREVSVACVAIDVG